MILKKTDIFLFFIHIIGVPRKLLKVWCRRALVTPSSSRACGPFYFSYCNRNIFNLRPGLVVFHNQVVCGEIIEIFNLRIQLHCRCRIWCSGNQFLDYRYMSVINMAVRNHMNQFSSFHITYLGNHH